MRNTKTRQVALSGLLFALAMALSFIESSITPLLGLIPLDLGGALVLIVLAALSMPVLRFLTRLVDALWQEARRLRDARRQKTA